MIESSYYRINVTSATATPRYNGYGEKYAEVEMMLPQNLVQERDITAARMTVTKMKVSLAELPVCSVPVTYYSRTSLRTPFKVMSVPVKGVTSTGGIVFYTDTEEDLPPYFVSRSRLIYDSVFTGPEHLYDAVHPDEAKFEVERGYHNYGTLSQFLNDISNTIQRNIHSNRRLNPTPDPPGAYRLEVQTDNTINLFVNPYVTSGTVQLPLPIPYYDDFSFTLGDTIYGANLSYISATQASPNHPPSPFLIGVNEDLKNSLHTLPWIRYRAGNAFGNWDEEFIYFLDTRQSNLYPSQNDKGWQYSVDFTSTTPRIGLNLNYHFVGSDAVSVSNINSIALILDGVDVRNQVMPINLTQDRHAGQVTTVPIIELYYPLCTKPSDLTTDLIIKNDQVSNTGPIKIDPQILKERSMRFKLVYITNAGNMRDMMIPGGSSISFQLCIEVFHR